MGSMAKIGIIVIFLFFMGCQPDSNRKKYPLVEKQIIKKTLTDSYNPSVDILFIIDNSGSMGSFQELLSKNARLFIDKFLDTEFIDYHIAVTTSTWGFDDVGPGEYHTNPYSGPRDGELVVCKNLAGKTGYDYSNYVDRNTPRGPECLKEMMRVGIKSQTHERFLNIPALTLSNQDVIKSSFYRSHAHLAVIVITDSYDQSNTSVMEAYQFLLNLKEGDKRKIHYAAGLVTFGVPQYKCAAEEYPPTSLIEMVNSFGSRGYRFNLCQFDYGKEVAYFADHLVDSALTIPLNRLPDMDTIEVRYSYSGNSQLVPKGFQGWSYSIDDNAIHLSRDIQLKKVVGGKFDVKYEPLYTPEPTPDVSKEL